MDVLYKNMALRRGERKVPRNLSRLSEGADGMHLPALQDLFELLDFPAPCALRTFFSS